VETIQNEILTLIKKLFDENPEKSIDIEEIITESAPEMANTIKKSLVHSSMANTIKKSLVHSSKKMLEEHRTLSEEFVTRNIQRWAEAFDLLETLIVICTESGEEFNKSYRLKAVAENDLVFDLVVRHHARACHIAQEILCLLKNGFADAAHARWRALHEVAATAIFIAKHGIECAERFYFHDVVDSYQGMLEHKKYEHRLQEKGPTSDEIASCKREFDTLVEKYGKKYSDNYGWAAYLFPDHNRVGFAAIEKDVQLDHMRPYYKWASQNIHSGSKGLRNRLGLSETTTDILLVGQSNSGMTDPAHAAAISLSQITIALLFLEPTIDHIVIAKIIQDYSDEVGNTFLRIDKSK